MTENDHVCPLTLSLTIYSSPSYLKLEMKTEKTRQHIHNAIAAAQHEIDKERGRRKKKTILGVSLGVLGIVFPPALAAAGAMALDADAHHQNVIDGIGHIYLNSFKIHTCFLQGSMASNPGWTFQMIRMAS